MSRFGDETTLRVPPMRKSMIEDLALAFLHEIGGDSADAPAILNWTQLVEYVLPQHGVFFYAASLDELDDSAGKTQVDGDATNVLLRSDLFVALDDDDHTGNFARSTAAHELGHVVLHAPVIRRARAYPKSTLTLARVQRDRLKPYEDAEWQAWMFAGHLLMPRESIQMSIDRGYTSRGIAQAHGVSLPFLVKHMARLGM